MGLNLNLNINGAKRGLATPPVPTNVVITVVSDTEFSIAYVSAFPVEFWYSTTEGGVYTKHGDSASTPYPMTGLTDGTLYYVKVRAKNGSKYSEYSVAVSATTYSWYGVTIDESNSSPDLTRIGLMTLHASLPVQSLLKGCLLNSDGTVNYYLKADNWTKKADGSASVLDGSNGDVMIEIPEYYRKVENPSAGVYYHKISLNPISGFTKVNKFYVGAYKSTVNRTGTVKQWSIVNTNAEYRGGNNNATLDGGNATQLGKPATLISLTNFRTYARNKAAGYKWNVIPHKQAMLLYELFFIEYATLNSQKAVNATLTVDGYRQGGLGDGPTTVNSTEWNTFNSYYPLFQCGSTNSLANGSGEIDYTVTNLGGAGVNRTIKVNRYRGVENPFGDILEWCDGASEFYEEAGGIGKMYICDDPANFADGTATNYEYRGQIPTANGYMNTMHHDEKGIFIPKTAAGLATTYFCDYYYQPGLVNGFRALLRGGSANSTTSSGFVFLYTYLTAASTTAGIGTRLCYIP